MEWELEVINMNYDRWDSRYWAVATNSDLRSSAAQATVVDILVDLCSPRI